MLVTIFSDASMCPETLVSSWGGWTKSERGVARHGGVLKLETKNINVAEAAAIVKAVKMSLIQGVSDRGDEILLQTDNQAVPLILNGKQTGTNEDVVYGVFKDLCAEYGLTYRWRHVKGHKGHVTPRNSVNSYCDKVARYFLRLERHRREPSRYAKPHKVPFGLGL